MRSLSPQATNLTDWRHEMHDPLADLQAQAKDLLLTGGGEWSTEIEMPAHILEAAAEAVRHRPQYTHEYGLLALREAIAEKLAAENHIETDPRTDILVTSSATEAINVALRTLLEPGDEVVAGDPYYLSIYEPNVRLCGGRVQGVTVSARDNFRLDPDRVAAAIGPRTKLLLLTTPENPTGAVISPSAAEALTALAVKHDLWLVVDELYERFVYDGNRNTSIASLPGMRDRTITIQGFSKTYGLTGYRIGYVVANADLVRHMSKVHYATTLSASEVSQRVAIAALRGPQDWLEPIVNAYAQARDVLVEGLSALPGVRCTRPDGSIYVFPDISAYGLSSMEMTRFLIREARVANRPGSYFGAGGEGFVRFNVPPNVGVARTVVERIGGALKHLTPTATAGA